MPVSKIHGIWKKVDLGGISDAKSSELVELSVCLVLITCHISSL